MSERQLDGRAVLFVHGIGGAGRAWAGQLASFRAAGIHAHGAGPAGIRGPTRGYEDGFRGAWPRMSRQSSPRAACSGPCWWATRWAAWSRRRCCAAGRTAYTAAVLACTSPAFGNADGDFQKKFVADRLGPLDAGKTMADLAPKLVDRMMGPRPDQAGRAAGDRSDGRGAGRHLPRGGALPRRLRRARQPGAHRAFPCCAWPARRIPMRRRRWWSAWPARSPAPATCASPASGICPTWRLLPPSMPRCSVSCDEVRLRP